MLAGGDPITSAMRGRHNKQRLPFINVRQPNHIHWLQCEGQYWDGFQFLDDQQYKRQTYVRTYTLTGAKIALKALQKRYPAVTLESLTPDSSAGKPL